MVETNFGLLRARLDEELRLVEKYGMAPTIVELFADIEEGEVGVYWHSTTISDEYFNAIKSVFCEYGYKFEVTKVKHDDWFADDSEQCLALYFVRKDESDKCEYSSWRLLL